jgi:hypothetical protein
MRESIKRERELKRSLKHSLTDGRRVRITITPQMVAGPVAKQIRRDERERDLAAATESASRTLGTKVYGVIYADPPWPFDVWSEETGMDRAAAMPLPTMTSGSFIAASHAALRR